MDNAIKSDLLTTEQAASFLGIRPQTLCVWRTTGRYSLKFIKCGRSVKYRREHLEKFLESRTRTATA